jgi:hypothetical protein
MMLAEKAATLILARTAERQPERLGAAAETIARPGYASRLIM